MENLDKELKKYLGKVDCIFDIDRFLCEGVDESEVINYYEDSDLGYRVFHSTEGSIHMALNFDGKFNKDGYYEQARIANKYLRENKATKVLELASGKGFNSIFLARQNPSLEFKGIDLTPQHVAIAQKNAREIPNLSFEVQSFQELKFATETFDLVFEVEGICHATDMKLAISEAFRVLKPGGIFLLFDGFRKPEFNAFSKDLRTAARLVEAAMAVKKFWIINDWLSLVKETGYSEISVDNISKAIMPTLKRFQLLARGFFKWPIVSKTILKALSRHIVQNAIAGLLMPFTLAAGLQGYYQIVLKRGK